MENLLIKHDKSVLEALKKLNYLKDISRLILFVVDENQSVIGSLTDGDIRRNIIKNQNLLNPIGEICNKGFTYINDFETFIDFKEYLNKGLKILPVLDNKKRLVEIIDLTKSKSKIPIECVIMAGGRGKRLSPLTDKIPKPMLKLGNKPIIEHNIDRLISFGIKKIYITINYLGDQIQKHFGDGSSKGIKIEYIHEDKPLGTAGSLSLIKKIKTDYLLIINSDLFTNADISKIYSNTILNKSDITIASKNYKVDIPYAIFESENYFVKNFVEKPTYRYQSNAGIYLIKSNILKMIPRNVFYDITDLIIKLIDDKKIVMHEPITGYWIDIGSPSDYDNAKELINLLG